MVFAHHPPPELDNLVVELWDKHLLPGWRERAETPEQVLERWRATEHQDRVTEARARIENAQPEDAQLGEVADYMVIGHQVPVRKGKWRLVPAEVEDTLDERRQ